MFSAIRDNPKEYIIGDLHFFDANIIRIAPRPFKSVQEMNEYMINGWNDTVEDIDTVIVAGDFINFEQCTKEEGWDIIDQLKGNIILIVGNHDRPHLPLLHEYIRNRLAKGLSPKLTIIEYPIIHDGFWFISHEPMFVSEAAPYANLFAHVHLSPMHKDVSSRSFCVSAERLGYKPILVNIAKNRVIEYKET